MSDLYFGQNSIFEIISRTHGKKELAFVENLEVEVQMTNRRLYFFDSKLALTVSILDGASGRFGYLETEEKYLTAALMDVAPSLTIVNNDPSAYVEFHMMLNSKNEQGVVEQGIFVQGCRVTGSPESQAPRDEQHGTVSYIASTRFKIKGGGVQYTRFVSSAPAHAAAGDVAISGTGPFSGTLPKAAISVNADSNVTTRTFLAVFYNGNDKTRDVINGNVAFSVSGTQVVFPSGSFATTDQWAVVTAVAAY